MRIAQTIGFALFAIFVPQLSCESPLSHMLFDDDTVEESVFPYGEWEGESSSASHLPWSLESSVDELEKWISEDDFYRAKVATPSPEKVEKRRQFFRKPKVVESTPKRHRPKPSE